jgi:hypothetical protein
MKPTLQLIPEINGLQLFDYAAEELGVSHDDIHMAITFGEGTSNDTPMRLDMTVYNDDDTLWLDTEDAKLKNRFVKFILEEYPETVGHTHINLWICW